MDANGGYETRVDVSDEPEAQWEIARRLHDDGHYEEALERLLTLKEAGMRKVNLIRYIGASYYRLGRFQEAADELEKALIRWPANEALRKQHTRCLAKMKAEHRASAPPPTPTPTPMEPVEAINLPPCPVCGAGNESGQERCWQCFAELGSSRPAQKLSSITAPWNPWILAILAGLAGVGGLSLCVYHGFMGIDAALTDTPPLNLPGLADHLLYWPRLLASSLLVIPILICPRIGAWPYRLPLFGFVGITAAGLWLPPLQSLLVIIAAWGALCIIWAVIQAFPLSQLMAYASGAGALAIIIATASFGGLAGPEFLRDVTAVNKILATADTVGGHIVSETGGTEDMTEFFTLASSGSPWLDAWAPPCRFTLDTSPDALPLSITLEENGTCVFREIPETLPATISWRLAAGRSYALKVEGLGYNSATLRLDSVLPFVK